MLPCFWPGLDLAGHGEASSLLRKSDDRAKQHPQSVEAVSGWEDNIRNVRSLGQSGLLFCRICCLDTLDICFLYVLFICTCLSPRNSWYVVTTV